MDLAKKKILDVIKDWLDKEYISKEEFIAMDPSEKKTRKIL